MAPSTRKVDAQRRRAHLDARWASESLGAITRQDIRSWVADLRASGLSPASAQRCVHLLSASLAAAVDAEIIDANPAAKLRIDGGGTTHERYLSREEYSALRGQMPTVRDQLILDMLVYTGMRWGELAGLHAARVDLGRGLVVVSEVWDERGGQIKSTPKGKRARQVPLLPDLAARLGELTHDGQVCGYEHDRGRCVGPLLLTTPGGTVLRNQRWAAEVFRPAVESTGIGHVRIHDLRHTYASWLLQQGVPLAEVGKMLGHVSPVTTQRYAHQREQPSEAVLAALRGA